MADKKLDPFDVEALERAVNDSATRVSAIWISFLIFSLYLLIAATTVTQRQLLLAEPVTLPVLNIALPLWGFFFLTPVLFVILHAYVLLQVLLLGRTTAAYNTAVAGVGLSPEENISLRQRLANTLFAQIFAGSPREREGFIGLLLRAIVWITLAIAPILIVLAFQFSFLAYHSHIATWTHRFLIAIELVAFFVIWPLALDARREFQWPKIVANFKCVAVMPLQFFEGGKGRRNGWLSLREQALPWAACILYIVVPLSLATFPGEPHVNLFAGEPLVSVQCNGWLQRKFDRVGLRFDRLLVPGVQAVNQDKLAAIEKHTFERNLPPSQGERTQDFRDRDFNCSDLSGADLRRVDLTGARLVRSTLRATALDGASLDNAQLQGALLPYAELRGASLEKAQLQRAFLFGAQLQGASLVGAQLQGAYLAHAELQGALLDGVNLLGAHLRDAQLQGAELLGARLQGAVLDNAQLQGALLAYAELQGASLEKAQLQGADFSDTILDYSVLSNVWTWRARNAACTKACVIDHKPDSVLEARRLPTIPTTPDSIAKFVQRAIAEIPYASRKQQVAAWMHAGLDVNPAKDDTEAIAKVWSDCEEATAKIPKEKFDEEHAALLRNLVCDATRSRAAIAAGVISNWISDRDDRRAFSVQLARGLLSQDGKDCAATKDLDEVTKSKLLTAAGKVPPAAPAK